MSFENERRDIEARFSTAWAATTPVAYGNVPLEPPQNSSWVRLTILDGDAQQVSIGTGVAGAIHRNAGLIIAQIFTALGAGERPARLLADQVANIFRSAQFSDIICRSPRVEVIGDTGGYYQVNVAVPFQRDTVF